MQSAGELSQEAAKNVFKLIEVVRSDHRNFVSDFDPFTFAHGFDAQNYDRSCVTQVRALPDGARGGDYIGRQPLAGVIHSTIVLSAPEWHQVVCVKASLLKPG